MYINILRIHLFMTITNLNSACRTCRSAVFVAVQPRSVLDFNVPGLHRTILTGSRVGGHRASHYRYMTMIISPTRQQRSGRDAAFCTWRVRHSTHTYRSNNFARIKQMPWQRRISSTRGPLARTTYFCTPTHPTTTTNLEIADKGNETGVGGTRRGGEEGGLAAPFFIASSSYIFYYVI